MSLCSRMRAIDYYTIILQDTGSDLEVAVSWPEGLPLRPRNFKDLFNKVMLCLSPNIFCEWDGSDVRLSNHHNTVYNIGQFG